MTQNQKESREKNPVVRFTGIFIPVEILNMDELSSSECMLLSWIDALYSEEHGGCFASNEYFMKKLKIKESTVRAHISKLVELGLVERISFDGRTRIIRACKEKWFDENNQRSDRQKSSGLTAKKIAVRGPEKYHPTYIESKEDIKEDISLVATGVALSADADEIISFFIKKLEERKPDIKLPDNYKWHQEIERMIRIDKRDPKKIKAMIEWIHKDPFWSSNILSPKKLREQYDQIELQAIRKSQTNNAQRNKDYALRQKKNYPETYKNIVMSATYVTNQGSGKEVSFNLPVETFKRAFLKMFGINFDDLSERDKE